MRDKLNENPAVQLAVLGVVGVLFALMMFTMVLKKDPVPAPGAAPGATPGAAPVATPGATPAATPGVTTPDPAAPAAPTPDATPSTPPQGGGGQAGALKAGKGLPKPVVAAYKDDKAIALLVYDARGLADQPLKTFTERLDSRNDVAVFTVETRKIGEYSRITQGVNVSQAPALVVVQPQDLSEGVPTASVSYGFRNARSIEIALDNALYSGDFRGPYPE